MVLFLAPRWLWQTGLNGAAPWAPHRTHHETPNDEWAQLASKRAHHHQQRMGWRWLEQRL